MFPPEDLRIEYEKNRDHSEHHDGPSLARSFLGLLY
jgi:hypothetical protein